MLFLWYSYGIAAGLLSMVLLWRCFGITVIFLRYHRIDVDSCGIDVEFPIALLGYCCEIAGGLLRYSYYGIAVGLLRYCCDLAVGFL